MAKARVTTNDAEQQLVKEARYVAKLQAKRRRQVIELAEIDEEIAVAKETLGGLVAGEVKA